MTPRAAPLLTDLLKAVSRSFYLTVRVLPGKIRPQIGLAYLLARATDTIADTELVPVAQRLDALRDLRERILGTRAQALDFRELAGRQGAQQKSVQDDRLHTHEAEQLLLERIEEIVALVAEFSAPDQQRIREVLAIITTGQELDLTRFGAASAEN